MGEYSKRLDWMDALRGMMILLVIIFHGASRVQRYEPDALVHVGYFNLFWEPFRMPVLVFLSGMLLAQSMKKTRSQYVIGKVRQLLWPYLVWSVVFIGLLYATGTGANPDPLWVQLLGITSGSATYLWFLSFLFVYYMLSIAIPPLVREILIPVALVAAIPLIWTDWGYQWQKMLFLLAFFWLGDMVTRRNLLASRAVFHPATVTVTAVLAVATGVLAAMGWAVRYSPLTVVGILAGTIALLALARTLGGSMIEKPLAAVGRNSVVYYASHYVIIAVAYFVLNRLLGFNQPGILFVALAFLAIAGGWVLNWLRSRITFVQWLFVMPWPSIGGRSREITPGAQRTAFRH